MEYIIDTAGLSDDDISKTLQRIEDTYALDLKTESVGGYSYLLEAVDSDESVITIINREFTKLGYHFKNNGNSDTIKKASSDDDVKLCKSNQVT